MDNWRIPIAANAIAAPSVDASHNNGRVQHFTRSEFLDKMSRKDWATSALGYGQVIG
jgi:hypothetical protein